MRAIILPLLAFTMSLAALAQQRFDFKVRGTCSPAWTATPKPSRAPRS
jgi:hypothetical protein